MASLSSFEEIMEFRLAELRSQLAAEHQLALQQAVGYHSKQLALENSLLRSEVEALRQRVVGGPAVDPFAGKNRPLRSERVPGSPIVFAELLQELYAEEEPLEQLTDLLEDKMLFCLYCAQRNCQEVFRVPFGRRKAKRAPGGHAVARTASSSSLVSNRSSEAKWIAIAEPGSRRSLGQPPDASPLGRSCSAPAAGSRLTTASELDELEAFPLEISPTSQDCGLRETPTKARKPERLEPLPETCWEALSVPKAAQRETAKAEVSKEIQNLTSLGPLLALTLNEDYVAVARIPAIEAKRFFFERYNVKRGDLVKVGDPVATGRDKLGIARVFLAEKTGVISGLHDGIEEGTPLDLLVDGCLATKRKISWGRATRLLK